MMNIVFNGCIINNNMTTKAQEILTSPVKKITWNKSVFLFRVSVSLTSSLFQFRLLSLQDIKQ